MIDNTQLIDELIVISKEAGEAILSVYNSDFDYQMKDDLSPLTEADKISHQIIYKRLTEITPDIPIISEEGSSISFEIRSSWKKYWLIDPLDGTKEFLKKNGEFTVNIALIDNNVPILGVIHIPVTNETYWGSKHYGSFFTKGDNTPVKIHISDNTKGPIRIVCSRSHPSKLLDQCLKELKNYKIINKGSSIKFCLIACGLADIYPRFGPTSEWDTAAGDAIVRFSGGHISNTEGKPIIYNIKESFVNPDFIAANNQDLIRIMIKHIKK